MITRGSVYSRELPKWKTWEGRLVSPKGGPVPGHNLTTLPILMLRPLPALNSVPEMDPSTQLTEQTRK